MLRIRSIYLALALITGLAFTAHTGTGNPVVHQSSSIQATAHVAPSLGLTEVQSLESEPPIATLDFEPGSHLFWLYCPGLSGVTVSIEPLRGESRAIPETAGLHFLQEYRYASLVGLSHELIAPDDDTEGILVTIIYTDN